MAALVIFESETAAVFPPHRGSDVEGIGEEGVVDLDFGLLLHVEQRRIGDIQGVAGLLVMNAGGLGLHLVGGRRFDVMNLAVITGPCVVSRQVFGIRRPGDGAQRIVIPLRSIEAQREGRRRRIVPAAPARAAA